MATYYEHDRTVFFHDNLDLPIVELNSNNSAHDFSSKLFIVYFDCVEKTPMGQQLLAKLEADPRVSKLKGEMISRGSGGSGFDIKHLACWCLWHANNVGVERANLDLNAFLDSDDLTVINSLWITGIEVDEVFEIEDGIYLRPAHSMPDSREKEHFLQHDFFSLGHHALKPTCVITKNIRIPRIHSKEFSVLSPPKEHIFWTSRSRFYDYALLLNVLPNVTCLPYYATGHVEASTPLGPFGGSGGGGPVFDIPAKITSRITADNIELLKKLLLCYDKLDAKSRVRIQIAINRLSQAKRRIQLEDQLLDLGIAMEMLLLDNKTEQLAFSFRLRGSWLLSATEQERLETFKVLKDIYNCRSEVAHTGMLRDGNAAKIAKVRESLPKYQKIAENIFKKIILGGFPKWDELILNIQNQPLSQAQVNVIS